MKDDSLLGSNESTYESIEEPTPPPKKTVAKAREEARQEIDLVNYTNPQRLEKACDLATRLCAGMHTLPDPQTLKGYIKFYYHVLTGAEGLEG